MIKKISILLTIAFLVVACEKNDNDTFLDVNSSSSCSTPQGLAITNVTNQLADITWQSDPDNQINEEKSWEVRYFETVPTAYIPTDEIGDIPVLGNNFTTLYTNSNTVTINDLKASTNYAIYVRKSCGSESYSQWTKAMEIITSDN